MMGLGFRVYDGFRGLRVFSIFSAGRSTHDSSTASEIMRADQPGVQSTIGLTGG